MEEAQIRFAVGGNGLMEVCRYFSIDRRGIVGSRWMGVSVANCSIEQKCGQKSRVFSGPQSTPFAFQMWNAYSKRDSEMSWDFISRFHSRKWGSLNRS